jgi:hypothetical protein
MAVEENSLDNNPQSLEPDSSLETGVTSQPLAPSDPQSLDAPASLESNTTPQASIQTNPTANPKPPGRKRFSSLRHRKALVLTNVIVLVVLIFIGIFSLFLSGSSKPSTPKTTKPTSYATTSLSVQNVKASQQLQVGQASQLVINGQVTVGNTLVLTPTAAPTSPTAGQIYYSQSTNVPYYYNGTQFVSLAPTQGVTSLGGSNGSIGVGGGLQVTSGQLTLSNTLEQVLNNGLVTGLTGTSDQIIVSQATGNVTLSLPQDIGTDSTPSFSGITVPTLTARPGDSGLIVGNDDQDLSLQGGTTTLSDSANGFTTQLSFATPTANNAITVPDTGGTLCTTSGNCTTSAAIQLQATYPGTAQTGDGNITGTFAAGAFVGDGSNLINLNANDINSGALAVTYGGTGATDAADALTNLGAAASGNNADITSLTDLTSITPPGALTVGSASEPLTLQGSAATIFTAADAGFTTTLGFADPTTDASITLPNTSGTVAVQASGPLGLDSSGTLTCTTCLVSTTGNGGIAGVVSVNGFSGAISILQGTGLTVTNNSGSITVAADQDISTSATPTFSGLVLNGPLGVGTGTPQYPVDVNGDINTNGDYLVNGVPICTSSGCTSSGGSGNYIQNGTTIQTANLAIRSGSISNTTALIQGATGQTANIFSVQNSIGTSLLAVEPNGHIGVDTASPSFPLDVNGDINTNGVYRVNGAQIASSDLSDGSNLALLNANNIFQGTMLVGGTGSTNATNEFQVQNSSGNQVFSVDTSGNQLVLGQASALTGQIAFDGSGGGGVLTLVGPTTPNAGDYTLTIPAITANASICTDNSICAGYASSSGSGNYIQNSTTLQTNANLAIQSVAANDVGAVIQGTTSQSADLLDVEDIGGTKQLSVTPGGVVSVASELLVGSVVSPTYAVEVGGDLNLNSSTDSYRIDGQVVCNLSGCAASGGSGNYIQNSTTLQTANFTIQSAAAATSPTAVIEQATSQTGDLLDLDASNASIVAAVNPTGQLRIAGATAYTTALNIGTNTTTAAGGITFGSDTDLYRSGSAALKTDGSFQASELQEAAPDFSTGLELQSTTASSTRSTNLTFTDNEATPQSISLRKEGSNLVLLDNSGNVQLGFSPSTDGILFGTALDTDLYRSGTDALTTDGALTVAGSFTNNGATVFKDTAGGGANSTMAFQIQNAAGTNLFVADTVDQRIGIDTTSPPQFALDVNGDVNTSGVYRVDGTPICISAGCTAASGSGYYIQNGTSIQTTANFAIQSASVGSVTALIQAIASQTANLLQIQNSSSIVLDQINAAGALSVQSATSSDALNIGTNASTTASGGIAFGTDTNLYRSAANTLTTNGSLIVGGTGSTQSSSEFQVQNAAGTAALNVNTSTLTTTVQASADTTTLGSNLATCTDFTNTNSPCVAGNWSSSINGDWTMATASATHVTGNTATLSTNQVTPVSGTTYEISYTIGGTPTFASNLTVTFGGVTVGTYPITSANVTYTESKVVTAISNSGFLTFSPNSVFTNSISNVTIQQVTQEPVAALVVNNASGNPDIQVTASSSTTNEFIGLSSGGLNSSGIQDTTLGYQALQDNTTGSHNSAIGYDALQANSSGSGNTGVGSSALVANTIGISNTAIGYDALQNETIGQGNTAIGYDALGSVTSAVGNVAIGYTTASDITSGAQNVALGWQALNTDTSGSWNVALGYQSLIQASTANNVVALGQQTLRADTTGANNVALGYEAGYSQGSGGTTTGANNVFLGYNSGQGQISYQVSNSTALGQDSTVNQSNAVILGCTNGIDGCTAASTVGIGSQYAPNALTVSPGTYGTNATTGQGTTTTITESGTTGIITGSGTTFTAGMVGGTIYYSDGTNGTIKTYTSATSLTATTPKTVSAGGTYTIVYGGFNVTSTGTAYLQPTTDSTTAFQIQNAAGTSNLLVADTTDSRIGIGRVPTAASLEVASTGSNDIADFYNGTTERLQVRSTGSAVFTLNNGTSEVGSVSIGSPNGVPGIIINNTAGNARVDIRESNSSAGLSIGASTTGIPTPQIILSNTGTVIFQNSSNSTTAFQIQNAAGTSTLFDADTTNLSVGIDGASTTAGFALNVTGTINTSTQYDVGGVQIASSNLSDGSNLAKLNGTGPQNFTGNNEFSGTLLNSVNSNTAFVVQNTSSVAALSVNTNTLTTTVQGGTSTVTLGANLTPDQNMSDGNWTSTGWTTTTSSATNNTSNTSPLSTSQFTPTANTEYEVSYTFSGTIAAGNTITVTMGGSTVATYNFTSFSQEEDFTDTRVVTTQTGGTGTNPLTFTPNASFVGTISNVSVQTIASIPATLVVNNSSGAANIQVTTSSSTTNDFIGLNSGSLNSTGTGNVGLGTNALQGNTTGISNTAVGYNALTANTNGSENTAVGYNALSVSATGYANTAIGYGSLQANTSGADNAAVGTNALLNNTTGSADVAIGTNSLPHNTTGTSNIAVGSSALDANTTGGENVAIGQAALQDATTVSNNSALGYETLEVVTGAANTAFGSISLLDATTASSDVALGYNTGRTNSSGDATTTGSNDTFIGTNAGQGQGVYQSSGSTALGFDSTVNQSNAVILGCTSGVNSCGTTSTVGIGSQYAPNALTVSPSTYGTNGTAGSSTTITESGSTGVITGSGTTFTAGMVGGTIYYSDGSNATISAYTSTTSLTAIPVKTLTTATTYTIVYGGFNVTNTGTAYLQPTSDSTSVFKIQNAANTTTLLNANTTNLAIGIDGASTTAGYALNVTGSINASSQIYVNGIAVCTVNTCAAGSSSGGYIQNGTSVQTANFNIQSAAVGSVTATIQGIASQTADLLDVDNGSGAKVVSVNSNGTLLVQPATSSITGQIIEANSSQTADLLDLENSSGTILSEVTAAGVLQGGNGSGSNTIGTALNLAGGQGTGTGNGGNILFQIAKAGTTGSTLNSEATVATISGTSGSLVLQNATNSTTGFEVLNAAGTSFALDVDTTNNRVGLNTNVPNQTLTVNGGSQNFRLATPAGVSAVPSASGGSLATNTYYYKVTALDGAGNETNIGSSIEVSAVVTGPTGSVLLSWTADPGALGGYRVYRGTSSGGENVYYSVAYGTNSFTDTGGTSTSGSGVSTNNASSIFLNVSGNSYIDTGNVGIDTATPTSTLTVGGSFAAVGTVGTVSVDSSGSILGFSRSGLNYITATSSGGSLALGAGSDTNLLELTSGGAIQGNGANVSINALAAPTATLTSSSTGGSLAAGTYLYEIVSNNIDGASAAVATSPSSVTTSGSTSVNTLNWSYANGANNYIVYRSTNGGSTWSSNNVGTVFTITDNGTNYTWTNSVTPPTVATASGAFSALGATALFQSASNSTTAFQIQNASGVNLLAVNASTGQIAVGPAAVAANGVLTIGTNTTIASGGIYFGTDTDLYRSASNTLRTNGNLIVDSGIIAGGCTVGAAKLCVNTSSTLPAALINQLGSGDILDLQNNGTNVVSVGSAGNTTYKNSTNSTTAFQVQNTSGVSVLNVNTTNQTLTVQAGTSSATYGAQLMSSSESFPATTGWTAISGTASSATATHTNGGGTTALSPTPALSITNGTAYEVVYTVTNPNAVSTLAVTMGGQTVASYSFDANSNSTFTDDIVVTAGSTANLAFTPSTGFTGTISGVSVKPLTQNTAPALVVNNASGVANVQIIGSSDTSSVFIGDQAGESTTTGTDNTALGSGALQSNTSGYWNTAVGTFTLQHNTADQNTAVGTFALENNTAGSGNTALGTNALQTNTTGSSNSAVGTSALEDNTLGGGNTAQGYSALGANTTGGNNAAVGDQVLVANTTGDNNTGIGSYGTLLNNTTGGNNTAIGNAALQTNLTGSNNTAIGEGADVLSNNLQDATAIGAGAQVGESNAIVLGYSSANSINDEVGIGTSSPSAELEVDGTTLVKTLSTTAFVIQNTTPTALFTANTSSMIITIGGTSTSFATLNLSNAHFESSQTTAPTISEITCTGGTAAVTAGSTDSAGSFSTGAISGSGKCVITVAFNQAYATAPKSVLITPSNATAAANAGQPYVSSTSVNNFVITFNAASGTGTYTYNYWVIE